MVDLKTVTTEIAYNLACDFFQMLWLVNISSYCIVIWNFDGLVPFCKFIESLQMLITLCKDTIEVDLIRLIVHLNSLMVLTDRL